MAHIEKVVHKDDPVPCPRCRKKAQKIDHPLKPMPPDSPQRQNGYCIPRYGVL